MDHVIDSMRTWLEIYDDPDNEGWKDEKAIKCIKNALRELRKYYETEE